MKLIRNEVSNLEKDLETTRLSSENEATRIKVELQKVKDEIGKFDERITALENSHKTLQNTQDEHTSDIQNLTKACKDLKVDVQDVKDKGIETTTRTTAVELKQETFSNELDSLQKKQQDTSNRVDAVEAKSERMEVRILNLETTKSHRVFKFQAPDRNSYFCGRDNELKVLESRIKVTPNECVVSAVCGLGGTGKTSLAVEHVWQLKDQFLGGVFWISGENTAFFQTTLNDMARRIGTLKSDFNETLSETLYWLQSSEERWCVVIDNLDELELSMEILEFLQGQWKREACGHLVVTTRREPREIAEYVGLQEEGCIELKSFNTEEGIQFMKVRTGKDSLNEDKSIDELVQELGGLPLALEQAAAYVKSLRCSFGDYLHEYKEERLTLLNQKKARLPVQKTSKDRLAVITTWSLNFSYVLKLSEEYNLGCASSTVMEMSAFLAPDDIPFEIINEGIPVVEDQELKDCSKRALGPTKILSLLTKFSLFQQISPNSYSVHRLVQEVVRDRIEQSRIPVVLQSAIRMLHYSFEHAESPTNVCRNFEGDAVLSADNLPSLCLWGSLATHACVLYDHLLGYAERMKEILHPVLFSEETLRLMNEAAIYLSVCREKVKAFEIQKRKLEVLVNLENTPSERTKELVKSLDIPLKDVEYKLISRCMERERVLTEESDMANETGTCDHFQLKQSDDLRMQGNDAVREKKYRKALSLYSQAVVFTPDDHRLYSNRALCHLKLDQPKLALEDCDKCLKLSPLYSKALARKAWALHDLARAGSVKLESRARAAAALAVHVDPNGGKDQQFNKMFPQLFTKVVKSSLHLAQLLYLSPNMVILLEEGEYHISALTLNSNQWIVGLNAGATIKCSDDFSAMGGVCYLENICLPEGNAPLLCKNSAVVVLYRCDVSGGREACKDFPECNGGNGCVAESRGRVPCNREGKYGQDSVSGLAGSAGLQITDGTCFVDHCKIHNCGGGGVLAHGSKAHLHICNSEIFCNAQVGLEAREEGHLFATNNCIFSNSCHGVLVGPNASPCQFTDNKIFENAREGVLVCSTAHEISFETNDVYHNTAFGFSLDNSHVNIRSNRIFENGFYGVLGKSRTTAVVKENEIFANKCGGIHIGVNYSGRIVLESNNVHDHSGPWLSFQENAVEIPKKINKKEKFDMLGQYNPLPEGETTLYSEPPILCNNRKFNNEEGMFHPKQRVEKLRHNECAFCHSTVDVAKGKLRCSRCRYVIYCNKNCQKKHWSKHKSLCHAVTSRYSVTVKPVKVHGKVGATRTFGSHLKGIGKGPKPDPKSNKRFVVKIQTQNLNSHPLQLLTVYDRSLFVDCSIQSPEIFHIIMECGVLGALHKFTSKKAFFWATFANNGNEMTIFLDELAPYKEW